MYCNFSLFDNNIKVILPDINNEKSKFDDVNLNSIDNDSNDNKNKIDKNSVSQLELIPLFEDLSLSDRVTEDNVINNSNNTNNNGTNNSISNSNNASNDTMNSSIPNSNNRINEVINNSNNASNDLTNNSNSTRYKRPAEDDINDRIKRRRERKNISDYEDPEKKKKSLIESREEYHRQKDLDYIKKHLSKSDKDIDGYDMNKFGLSKSLVLNDVLFRYTMDRKMQSVLEATDLAKKVACHIEGD